MSVLQHKMSRSRRRTYLGMIGTDGCVVTSVNGSADISQPLRLETGGVLTVNADGSWIFQPSAEFIAGADSMLESIAYEFVADGIFHHGNLFLGGADLTVNEHEPAGQTTATDDSLQQNAPAVLHLATPTAVPVTFDLRLITPDCKPDAATLVLEASQNGMALVNANGTITFTPDRSFAGRIELQCLTETTDGRARFVDVYIQVTRPVLARDSLVPAADMNNSKPDGVSAHEAAVQCRFIALHKRCYFEGRALPNSRISCRIRNQALETVFETGAITDKSGRWSVTVHALQPNTEHCAEFYDPTGVSARYGNLRLDDRASQDYRVIDS